VRLPWIGLGVLGVVVAIAAGIVALARRRTAPASITG
jgi:hypothetical protein